MRVDISPQLAPQLSRGIVETGRHFGTGVNVLSEPLCFLASFSLNAYLQDQLKDGATSQPVYTRPWLQAEGVPRIHGGHGMVEVRHGADVWTIDPTYSQFIVAAGVLELPENPILSFVASEHFLASAAVADYIIRKRAEIDEPPKVDDDMWLADADDERIREVCAAIWNPANRIIDEWHEPHEDDLKLVVDHLGPGLVRLES